MLDIRQFGAIPDGKTLNTRAIQDAIDTCSRDRHSGVLIQGGAYLTGSLSLKSHVTLHVAGGSTLLGSGRIGDYATDTHKNMYKNEPHMDRCLLFARNATGIAIEGNGVIDGQGGQSVFPNPDDPQQHRPMLLRLLECSRIRVRDITLQNPASWTSAWLYCSDIAVDGVTIRSRVNANGDGLDFDGCSDVRVSNCSFDTSDDSICLQTSRPDAPCRNVTISNIAGLTITNSALRTAAPDTRPTIACHRVTHARFHNIAATDGQPATIYLDGQPTTPPKATP